MYHLISQMKGARPAYVGGTCPLFISVYAAAGKGCFTRFVSCYFSLVYAIMEPERGLPMDQGKIGRFIARLRKERGMTQEQLGERLGVSQRTVSRWETGRNMPDIGLLPPLAETLGVTVAELLEGQRLGSPGSMSPEEVQALAQKVLKNEDDPARGGPDRKKWAVRYGLCFVIALIEIGVLTWLMARDPDHWDVYWPAVLMTALAVGFGAYFCLFARTRLPWYHDVGKISMYCDGPLRMNVPGVRFNNRSWPHILLWVRAWCLLAMTLCGVLCLGARVLLGSGPVAQWLPMVTLAGLLAAIYVPGRKYG